MKVGTYSQINEYMRIYDNPRSWSFIDYGRFEAKLHMESPWDIAMKICSTVLGRGFQAHIW